MTAPRDPDIAAGPACAHVTLQQRFAGWVASLFGRKCLEDMKERRLRFLEEAIELFQAAGGTDEELRTVGHYVMNRPIGEVGDEVGGVVNTLACLSAAAGVDLLAAAETNYAICVERGPRIKAKHAGKPAGIRGTAPVLAD